MAKIIPTTGLISIKDLAEFTDAMPAAIQDSLSKCNIRTFKISQRYNQRLVSLAAIDEWLKMPLVNK